MTISNWDFGGYNDSTLKAKSHFQVVALLSRVLGSCKLRDLNVEGCNLAQVPSTILALALSRLRLVLSPSLNHSCSSSFQT